MMPLDPEQIYDPKLSLVNLARKSKSARIRDALAPTIGSTAKEGKLYTSEMKTFIAELWDIESARKTSRSLDKALISLEKLS